MWQKWSINVRIRLRSLIWGIDKKLDKRCKFQLASSTRLSEKYTDDGQHRNSIRVLFFSFEEQCSNELWERNLRSRHSVLSALRADLKAALYLITKPKRKAPPSCQIKHNLSSKSVQKTFQTEISTETFIYTNSSLALFRRRVPSTCLASERFRQWVFGTWKT